jgi:hypothetical protein
MTLSFAFFTAAEKTAQGESDCADDGNKKKVAPQSFRLSECIDPTKAKTKYSFFTTTALGDKLRGKAFLNCYFLTNSLFLSLDFHVIVCTGYLKFCDIFLLSLYLRFHSFLPCYGYCA